MQRVRSQFSSSLLFKSPLSYIDLVVFLLSCCAKTLFVLPIPIFPFHASVYTTFLFAVSKIQASAATTLSKYAWRQCGWLRFREQDALFRGFILS